jgi:hypothetical protein
MPLRQRAYATGTPYVLTNTPAQVQFGTTSPIITFIRANGKLIVLARAVVNFVNAVMSTERNITLKLRRTNHTAADIPNSSTVIKVGVSTSGQSMTGAVVELPPVEVTLSGTSGDVVELWASIDSLPDSGDIVIKEASIVSEL